MCALKRYKKRSITTSGEESNWENAGHGRGGGITEVLHSSGTHTENRHASLRQHDPPGMPRFLPLS